MKKKKKKGIKKTNPSSRWFALLNELRM